MDLATLSRFAEAMWTARCARAERWYARPVTTNEQHAINVLMVRKARKNARRAASRRDYGRAIQWARIVESMADAVGRDAALEHDRYVWENITIHNAAARIVAPLTTTA